MHMKEQYLRLSPIVSGIVITSGAALSRAWRACKHFYAVTILLLIHDSIGLSLRQTNFVQTKADRTLVNAYQT
eukprot:5247016-Amphidinium_carterae.1